jgi:hypothetical protein
VLLGFSFFKLWSVVFNPVLEMSSACIPSALAKKEIRNFLEGGNFYGIADNL